MSGARSFFWAASSVVVALIGAFGPWATKVGLTVDGSDDELTAIAALVAALALVVFSITRNRKLTAIPLLAGLISVVLVGHDLTDPAGPFGGPGPNIHLSWGIWTALAGSVGMALASLALNWV